MSLFEIEPRPRIAVGDEVDVQVLWGIERCELVRHETIDGFPMMRVRPLGGSSTFLADVARVESVVHQPELQGFPGLMPGRKQPDDL